MPNMPIIARKPLMVILDRVPERASITMMPVLLTAIEGELPMAHRTKTLTLIDVTWSDPEDDDQRDAYRAAHFLVLGEQIMEI